MEAKANLKYLRISPRKVKIVADLIRGKSLAQATGILAFKSVGKLEPGELYYFAGIDEARFKRPVVPGDQMIMEVTFEKTRRGLTRFKGVALVDGKVVCEATMMCARSREA